MNNLKKLTKDKRSSLFSPAVSDRKKVLKPCHLVPDIEKRAFDFTLKNKPAQEMKEAMTKNQLDGNDNDD